MEELLERIREDASEHSTLARCRLAAHYTYNTYIARGQRVFTTERVSFAFKCKLLWDGIVPSFANRDEPVRWGRPLRFCIPPHPSPRTYRRNERTPNAIPGETSSSRLSNFKDGVFVGSCRTLCCPQTFSLNLQHTVSSFSCQTPERNQRRTELGTRSTRHSLSRRHPPIITQQSPSGLRPIRPQKLISDPPQRYLAALRSISGHAICADIHLVSIPVLIDA